MFTSLLKLQIFNVKLIRILINKEKQPSKPVQENWFNKKDKTLGKYLTAHQKIAYSTKISSPMSILKTLPKTFQTIFKIIQFQN